MERHMLVKRKKDPMFTKNEDFALIKAYFKFVATLENRDDVVVTQQSRRYAWLKVTEAVNEVSSECVRERENVKNRYKTMCQEYKKHKRFVRDSRAFVEPQPSKKHFIEMFENYLHYFDQSGTIEDCPIECDSSPSLTSLQRVETIINSNIDEQNNGVFELPSHSNLDGQLPSHSSFDGEKKEDNSEENSQLENKVLKLKHDIFIRRRRNLDFEYIMMRKRDALLNDELKRRGIPFEEPVINQIKTEDGESEFQNMLDLITDK